MNTQVMIVGYSYPRLHTRSVFLAFGCRAERSEFILFPARCLFSLAPLPVLVLSLSNRALSALRPFPGLGFTHYIKKLLVFVILLTTFPALCVRVCQCARAERERESERERVCVMVPRL